MIEQYLSNHALRFYKKFPEKNTTKNVVNIVKKSPYERFCNLLY